MLEKDLLVEPVSALERLPRYSVGRPPFETDLDLDFNESLAPLPVIGVVEPGAAAAVAAAQAGRHLVLATETTTATAAAPTCIPARRASGASRPI